MATPFQVEAWTEYAIGLLVLLVRIVYRSTIVGTNWEGDDYFALIAVFFWTVCGGSLTASGFEERLKLTFGFRENW